jgi:hypothetical protein
MLQGLTASDITLEKNLADQSRVRLDRSYPEHLKLAERRHQILVVMKPLIHRLVTAEASTNILLATRLAEELEIERSYLLEISRVPAFEIDPNPITTGEYL